MASEYVTRKAQSLILHGKVHQAAATAYLVEGDHDTYTVIVYNNGEGAECNCKAGREGLTCSHQMAAWDYHFQIKGQHECQ
jgi:hypothetical protein